MRERRYKKHHHRNHDLLEAQQLELVKSGEDYFTRAVDIIDRSAHIIHLQIYILIDDETGKTVIEALCRAVKRGVKVAVLVDAFGSMSLNADAAHAMEESGILFRKFSPLFANYRLRFGRRLHHKILVSDENEALVGGINIEDKYHLAKEHNTPWLDYAVYIKGPVCQYINYVCENTWNGKFYRTRMKGHTALGAEELQKGIQVIVRHNDWVQKKEGISRSLRNALKNSSESVTIMGAYFLPGKRVRKSLKNASARQVKIRLILQGISDVTLVKKASTWWYTWLLRNNIEIYEWTKTVLHGKMTLIDNNWASIGSYNINHLSDYDSIETNIEVHDPAFCNSVREEMERVMKSSERITSSEYHNKMKPLRQFTCWLSFHIVRLLFGLQSFLLSKE